MAEFENIFVRVQMQLDSFRKGIAEMQTSMTKVQSRMSAVGTSMTNVGRGMTVGLTLPMALVGRSALKMAGEFESAGKAFEVMLGDVSKGQAMLKNLESFSLKTPFTPNEIIRNGKLLLNFGFEAESILPSLQMLGDISGGNAQRFNQLSLAFAQSASAGRLMGQDLLQMINAGFNPLQIIAEQTGKTMGELKEEMGEGKISFDQVRQAFVDATSEGGKFNGMMEAISQTYEGKLSTAQGNFNKMMQNIGQMLLPQVNKALDWFNSNWQNISGAITAVNRALNGFLPLIAGVVASAGPLLVIFGTLAKTALPALVGGLKLVGSGLALLVSPIGLVTAGLVAIGIAMYNNWDRIKPIIVNLVNGFIDIYNSVLPVRVAIQSVVMSFETLFLVGKKWVSTIVEGLGFAGKAIVAFFAGDMDQIPKMAEETGEKLTKTWENTGEEIAEIYEKAMSRINGAGVEYISEDDLDRATGKMSDWLTGIKTKIQNFFNGFQSFGGGGAVDAVSTEVGGAFGSGMFDDAINNYNAGSERLLSAMLVARQRRAEAMNQEKQQMQNNAESLASGITGTISSAMSGLLSAGGNIGKFFSGVINSFGNFLVQFGTAGKLYAVAVEALKKTFLNPGASIAASIGVVALGAVLKGLGSKFFAPKLAEGGLASGPTLAMVGDNPRAYADPEVISPLSKLKNMMGGGAMIPEIQIRGEDLYIVLKEYERRTNATR